MSKIINFINIMGIWCVRSRCQTLSAGWMAMVFPPCIISYFTCIPHICYLLSLHISWGNLSCKLYIANNTPNSISLLTLCLICGIKGRNYFCLATSQYIWSDTCADKIVHYWDCLTGKYCMGFSWMHSNDFLYLSCTTLVINNLLLSFIFPLSTL